MVRLCLVIALGSLAIAQVKPTDVKPGPVELRRVPAKPPTSEGVPSPEKYPFDKLIQSVETDAPMPRTLVGPPLLTPPVSPGAEVPRDFKPNKDVPLPETAKDALSVGQAWMTGNHVPAPGKDGRVLYIYGAGLPTLVCAPLRLCVVELEPGEKLLGEPHLGDAVRWVITPATCGSGTQSTSMIVVKPKQPGLDTNLLVTTDRRAYYLRLVSKPEEYLARIAFSYPDDEALKWRQHLAQQERDRREEIAASQVAPISAVDSLYFDYRITGGDENIRPVRVVDDGKKTFIQMTPNAANREAPTLVVVGPEGPEMVNYRVKGDMYIVDRIFERGALVLGVGKKSRRVDIIRGTNQKDKK